MSETIEFRAKKHEFSNCMCDCCMEVGKVYILEIPDTKFRHDPKDSHSKLQRKTKYNTYWICPDCFNALNTAISEVLE